MKASDDLTAARARYAAHLELEKTTVSIQSSPYWNEEQFRYCGSGINHADKDADAHAIARDAVAAPVVQLPPGLQKVVLTPDEAKAIQNLLDDPNEPAHEGKDLPKTSTVSSLPTCETAVGGTVDLPSVVQPTLRMAAAYIVEQYVEPNSRMAFNKAAVDLAKAWLAEHPEQEAVVQQGQEAWRVDEDGWVLAGDDPIIQCFDLDSTSRSKLAEQIVAWHNAAPVVQQGMEACLKEIYERAAIGMFVDKIDPAIAEGIIRRCWPAPATELADVEKMAKSLINNGYEMTARTEAVAMLRKLAAENERLKAIHFVEPPYCAMCKPRVCKECAAKMEESYKQLDRGEGVPLEKVIADLKDEEIAALRSSHAATTEENTRLRAALARCKSGFPGCGRADDMMGCPEFGAAMEADQLRESLQQSVQLLVEGNASHAALVERLRELAANCKTDADAVRNTDHHMARDRDEFAADILAILAELQAVTEPLDKSKCANCNGPIGTGTVWCPKCQAATEPKGDA